MNRASKPKLFKHKPKYHKPEMACLPLTALCEKYGRPEWERQIINRIINDIGEEHLEDDFVSDLIGCDVDKHGVMLTATGIFYFLHILRGYFDEDGLKNTAKYMRAVDERNKSIAKLEYYKAVLEYAGLKP